MTLNPQQQKVLAMLRFKGSHGVTTRDFLHAGVSRFAARIHELIHDHNFQIDKVQLPKEPGRSERIYRYTLHQSDTLFSDEPQTISAVSGRAA